MNEINKVIYSLPVHFSTKLPGMGFLFCQYLSNGFHPLCLITEFALKIPIIYFKYIDCATSISVIFFIILAAYVTYKTQSFSQVQGQSLYTCSVVQFLRHPVGMVLIINPKSQVNNSSIGDQGHDSNICMQMV